MIRALRVALPPLTAALAVAVLWEVAVRMLAVPAYLLPAPSAIVQAAWDDRARLLAGTLQTAMASAGGLALAVAAGVLLGSALGASRGLQRAFYPLALLFQMVPLVAIAPLLVIWLGYGLRSTMAAAAIVAVFPVLASTLDGMRSTDTGLREIFRIHGASRLATWWKLELPSSVPAIVTGARVAAGLAVIGAVVGEFVSGSAGEVSPLGLVVTASMRQSRTDLVFAAVGLSACVGFALFGIVGGLGWLLLRRWHASAEQEVRS
ncbi:MAG: ABC transporter permease [Planctomycetes bacterium]|nr:ABC transporter permease [Planctomycetota bacterium]